MKQSLDRRRRTSCIEETPANLVDHRVVFKRVERTKPSQRIDRNGWQVVWRCTGEIAARGFDADGVDVFTYDRATAQFYGNITAAMQHKIRIGADQSSGVEPKCKLLATIVAPPTERVRNSLLTPATFHLGSALWCRNATTSVIMAYGGMEARFLRRGAATPHCHAVAPATALPASRWNASHACSSLHPS